MAAFQLLFTFFVKEMYNRLNSHKACKIVPHLRLNIYILPKTLTEKLFPELEYI